MTHPVWFIFVVVPMTMALGNPVDQGPQTFYENSKPRPQYQEVLLYLTPSQIRALEQGQKLDEKTILSQNPQLRSGSFQNLQQAQNENTRKYLDQQRKKIQTLLLELVNQRIQSQSIRNNTENQNGERDILHQPREIQLSLPRYNDDQYGQLAEQLITYPDPSQNKAYFKTDLPQSSNQFEVDANLASSLDSVQQPLPQQELPERSFGVPFRPDEMLLKADKSQSQFPVRPHFVFDPLLEQRYQLIPYEYLAEQQREHQKLLMENQGLMFHLQADEQKQQEEQKQRKDNEEEKVTHLDMINQQQELKFQYAPNFNDRRYNSDSQNTLSAFFFENLNAKAAAEAIANSPPIIIHKDITIMKHRPNIIIKSIKVPVPTSYLLPYPQSYELRYPQPYTLPIEIVQRPVPIAKTEDIQVEKPVPVRVEKRVPFEIEKKVYAKGEKPFSVERIVPLDTKREMPVEVPLYRPEKLTILRHIWQHN